MYSSAYFSNAFYGTLLSAQLITGTNITFFLVYASHKSYTLNLFIYDVFIYLLIIFTSFTLFICLFVCLFALTLQELHSSGLLHNPLHNSPEVRSSNLLRGGCVESRNVCMYVCMYICMYVYKYIFIYLFPPPNTPFYVTVILASCKASSTMDNMKPY